MEYMKFNFVSNPNQTLIKKENGEEVDIYDFFDTSQKDDFISGYFRKVDYDKGVITICGELTESEIIKIFNENTYLSGDVPNIYDIKQRIDILTDEWDIDWEIEELTDIDGDVI